MNQFMKTNKFANKYIQTMTQREYQQNQIIIKKKLSQSLDKHQRKRGYTNHRVDYKGITLKQYFRLLHDTIQDNTLRQIKEEGTPEQSQQAQTPDFGFGTNRVKTRLVVKTEMNEQNYASIDVPRKNLLTHIVDTKSYNKINISLQNANVLYNKKRQTKAANYKSKRLVTNSSKIISDPFNKTSMGEFYFAGAKKQKMMQKMKQQKQRIKSMKLDEAMLVTKYATKFNINAKNIMK